MLDDASTNAVNQIRDILPPAPLRDDSPHVTLLRSIGTPSDMKDEDLLEDMERILKLSSSLPFTARVVKISNIYSPLFGITSSVTLKASSELATYQKKLKKVLRAQNYSIGFFARLAFMPHISVRLGVPYNKQAKETTEKVFAPGTKLTFVKWAILRDVKKDGKYLVKEIVPDS